MGDQLLKWLTCCTHFHYIYALPIGKITKSLPSGSMSPSCTHTTHAEVMSPLYNLESCGAQY